MSAIPSMTTAGNELCMAVPYPLNGAFRAIFKTAKWNANAKVFNAAATTQNRKKWEQFLASVKDAVVALANADQVEATHMELERAVQEAERAVEKAQASIREIEQRMEAARERTRRAEEQLAECAPVLEKASAALTAVLVTTAAAEGARDVVIAPALTLYETHGLTGILDAFEKATRRGYVGKEASGRAQKEIRALRDDLGKIGFRLEALSDLANVSLNRPDKISEYVASAKATMHSGLGVIETND
jgi:hypothetical protein